MFFQEDNIFKYMLGLIAFYEQQVSEKNIFLTLPPKF